jgi:hypothetical protein
MIMMIMMIMMTIMVIIVIIIIIQKCKYRSIVKIYVKISLLH